MHSCIMPIRTSPGIRTVGEVTPTGRLSAKWMANWGAFSKLIEGSPRLRGKTTIFLTSDHGGKDRNHVNNLLPEVYTIPVYVWGCGVAASKDLYKLNATTRRDPGTGHPLHTDPEPTDPQWRRCESRAETAWPGAHSRFDDQSSAGPGDRTVSDHARSCETQYSPLQDGTRSRSIQEGHLFSLCTGQYSAIRLTPPTRPIPASAD